MAQSEPSIDTPETVELPAPPDGQFYGLLPKAIVKTLGYGFGELDFDLETHATAHPYIAGGLVGKGLVESLIDSTAGKSDDEKCNAVVERLAKFEDGTYVFRDGKTAVPAYDKLLAEYVARRIKASLNITLTGARAMVKEDGPESAMRAAADKIAPRMIKNGHGGMTPEIVMTTIWAAVQNDARAESDRLAAAADIDAGAMTPDAIAAAMVAMQTPSDD